jgi:hypothetical protein
MSPLAPHKVKHRYKTIDLLLNTINSGIIRPVSIKELLSFVSIGKTIVQ